MSFRTFFALTALVAGCSLQVFAAKPKLPPRYDQWLKQDVVYIITDQERKAFLALQTDAQRDKFIDDFWAIRNPHPGSDHNVYKDEIYSRIQYANEHFGRMTNTPGWMTDMGRAYIELGKPVSEHAFVGYGQIYPLELWSYSNNTGNPSLPPFFNILFYQPEGIEEYRFYRPYMDGPLKLVRGTNFNTNADVYKALMGLGGDVAHAAFTAFPNDPVDTQSYQPDMSSDMLINKIANLANDPFNLQKLAAMRALRGRVTSYFLLAQNRALKIDSFVLPDPTGQYWLDYAVAVDNPEMGAAAKNGTDLDLRVDYHLTTMDGHLVLEDSEQRSYRAFMQGPNGKVFVPFEVANRLPIVPGQYKLEVDVVNQAAGKIYKGILPVDLAPAKTLTLRGPLLTGQVEKVERPDGFTPFEYYGVEFHPSAQEIFVPRAPLTVLYELERPSASSQGYSVDYVLAHVTDREARRTFTDTVAASDFHDGRLLKSKTLPLAGLGPGDYRLVMNVRESAGGPVVATANVPLEIVNDRQEPALYMSANSRNMGRRGVAAYLRGLEAAAQKDEPGAAGYMRQAIDQNPSNGYAGDFLVQLYFRQRNYGGVADLYRQLGIAAFKTSSQAMAEISLSMLETGHKDEARKVLETARLYFPGDPTLKTAALEVEKAR
jgi:GWxTD domain-containing protein